jgi:hypothetical protein
MQEDPIQMMNESLQDTSTADLSHTSADSAPTSTHRTPPPLPLATTLRPRQQPRNPYRKPPQMPTHPYTDTTTTPSVNSSQQSIDHRIVLKRGNTRKHTHRYTLRLKIITDKSEEKEQELIKKSLTDFSDILLRADSKMTIPPFRVRQKQPQFPRSVLLLHGGGPRLLLQFKEVFL